MELQEISEIPLEDSLEHSFSLKYYEKNRIVLYGNHDITIIMDYEYDGKSMQPFCFLFSYAKPPNYKEILWKNIISDSLISNCDLYETQKLFLDPLYASLLCQNSVKPQIVDVCFPNQQNSNNETPMAILSNLGCCEIRYKNSLTRDWDIILCSIDNIWRKNRPIKYEIPLKTFKNLEKFIEDTQFTAICWADQLNESINDEWILICITASGWLSGYSITNKTSDLIFSYKSDMHDVRYMKYLNISNLNGILICSNVDGIVKSFELKNKNLQEQSILWSSPDKMTCNYFEFQYYSNNNKIAAITAKGAYVLVFLLSSKGKLIEKVQNYIGYISITGIQSINTSDIIICTLLGSTKKLNISYKKNLKITVTNIKNNIHSKNFNIFGMAATKNKAAWIFALYPNKVCETETKILTILKICSFTTINPLEILLEKKSSTFLDLCDCAEVIRCSFFNNIVKSELENFSPKLLHLYDDDYIRQLKIRLIIVNGLYIKSIRFTEAAITTKCESERNELKILINVLMCYRRLTYLRNFKDLSKFQKLSGKNMLHLIKEFLTYEDVSENFKTIRNIISPILDEIIFHMEYNIKSDNQNEHCNYCNEIINSINGKCPQNHNMEKCIITYVQVPLFTGRHCPQCKGLALDDDKLLREIVGQEEEFVCPICSFPLAKYSIGS